MDTAGRVGRGHRESFMNRFLVVPYVTGVGLIDTENGWGREAILTAQATSAHLPLLPLGYQNSILDPRNLHIVSVSKVCFGTKPQK